MGKVKVEKARRIEVEASYWKAEHTKDDNDIALYKRDGKYHFISAFIPANKLDELVEVLQSMQQAMKES